MDKNAWTHVDELVRLPPLRLMRVDAVEMVQACREEMAWEETKKGGHKVEAAVNAGS